MCQTAALGTASAWLELSHTGAVSLIHRVYWEICCFAHVALTAHPNNKLKLLFMHWCMYCISRSLVLKRDLKMIVQIHERKNLPMAIKHGHPSITTGSRAVNCWRL